MKKFVAIIVGLIILAVLCCSASPTRSPTTSRHSSRFGKIDESSIIRSPDCTSGFRSSPTASTPSTRVQLVETPMDNLQTKDGKMCRAFMLWKIDEEGVVHSISSFSSSRPCRSSPRSFVTRVGAEPVRLDELLGKNSKLSRRTAILEQ